MLEITVYKPYKGEQGMPIFKATVPTYNRHIYQKIVNLFYSKFTEKQGFKIEAEDITVTCKTYTFDGQEDKKSDNKTPEG